MSDSDQLLPLFAEPLQELCETGEVRVHHGPLDRLPRWMRSGLMENVDALCRAYSGPLEVAQGPRADRDRASCVGAGAQTPIAGCNAETLLRLGLTVYFRGLMDLLPEARGLARDVEQALGIPRGVGVSAFANAPGSGLPLHHDPTDQILINLQGEKDFIFGPRDVEHPTIPHSSYFRPHDLVSTVYAHGLPSEHDVEQRGLTRVTLLPGSCVFFPAGTWHKTVEQRGTCLSLACSIRVPSRLELLLQALRFLGSADPTLRRPALGFFGPGDAAPPAWPSFSEDLEQAGRLLAQLSERDLRSAWEYSLVRHGDPSTYPAQPLFARYLRCTSTEIRYLPEGKAQVRCVVRAAGLGKENSLVFAAEAQAVVEFCRSSALPVDADLLGKEFPDFEPDELRSFLDQLAQVGVLQPIPVPACATRAEA